MLTQSFRDVLPRAKQLGAKMVDQLDDIIAQFSGLWSVEHKDDGHHGDVTADSLVVNGPAEVEYLKVEGDAVDGLNVLVESTSITAGLRVLSRQESASIEAFVFPENLLAAAQVSVNNGTESGVFSQGGNGTRIDVSSSSDGLSTNKGYREYERAELMGNWEDWVPTLTSTGVSPALGDATVSARKMYIGRTVFFNIVITFGATSTFGTGLWLISMPETVASSGPVTVEAVNTGVAVFLGNSINGPGSTGCLMWIDDPVGGAANWATAATPFAWGPGDSLTVKGFFEF